MAATLSTVTIISDNKKYPTNKIDVIVDNDLNPSTTIVVPKTSFPYIVEFENCQEAYGKRYISERFYNKLTNEIDGAYNSLRGKIFSTLQKENTIYPYITIDYLQYVDKINEEKNKIKTEKNKNFKELNYYGADLDIFENYSPILLLQWLDLPLKDSNSQPIKSFPFVIGYSVNTAPSISIDLLNRKIKDFFSTEYFVRLEYLNLNQNNSVYSPLDAINIFADSTDALSKENFLNSLKEKSKSKSLTNILDNIKNIKGSVLAGASLATTALSLKNKLSAPKPSVPKIPKPPVILPPFLALLKKFDRTSQKPKERKRISGKKRKSSPSISETKPAVKNLELRAGTLVATAAAAKAVALAKEQKITNPNNSGFASYTITSSINLQTITLLVTNNFGKPPFTKQYSAITFTPETAVTDMKFELDNFGFYDSQNGSYPKSGSPIPT